MTPFAPRTYNRVVDIGAFEFGSALPGDLNHDGTVNFADLLRIAQYYGRTDATWQQGDVNYDGKVDFADLLKLGQNYGAMLHASSSPLAGVLDEPGLRPRRGGGKPSPLV